MLGKIANNMVGRVFNTSELWEEHGPMEVLSVFYNEDWGRVAVQARPLSANRLGDQIFTLLLEDIYEEVK